MFRLLSRMRVRLLLCGALLTSRPYASGAAPLGEWPMPGHDVRHTSQAELPGNLADAPQEICVYDPGRRPATEAMCVDVDDDGEQEILYGGSPLVCMSFEGKEKWRSFCGWPTALGDIDGDGTTEILTQACWIVRGASGETVWRRTGPGLVGERIFLSKLLPDKKGLQVAFISTDFGEMTKYGQVWSFDQGFAAPQLVWERGFATWEHAGGAVGQWDDATTCLVAPTWGGFYALNAKDGSELMRLYWESVPGTNGLRNYGPLTMTDLDGDGQSEFIIMAREIALHMNVFAPWRSSAGEHSAPEKPWPAPARAKGELASYDSGPLLWQRDFGTWYPTEEYVVDVPTPHIADVDGDERREILATVGKGQWELKIYDGMTGAEKLSLPNLKIECACDLNDDGLAEIVARADDALVVGTFAAGRWAESLRLPHTRLVRAPALAHGNLPSEPLSTALRPARITTPDGPAWVGVKENPQDGTVDALVLLRGGVDGPLRTAETPLADMPGLAILAASGPYLVATTSDGSMHVMQHDGRKLASWDASATYIGGFSVADLDGDRINETVVCRADGEVAALRWNAETKAFEEQWRARGGGLGPRSATPQPLIVDVDVDGQKETLVACRTSQGKGGVQLLSSKGVRVWESPVPAYAATYGNFDGDDHVDFFLGARVEGPGSVGQSLQSFAISGRDGSVLWRNVGADKIVWHRQMGPSHQMPTVVDVNADGRDDVALVALDLCMVLDGRDGSFLQQPLIANEIWKQRISIDGQWTAYGLQIPIDVNGDDALDMLLAGAWGQFGVWSLKERERSWVVDPGKAELARSAPGIADVDGDQTLDIGMVHEGGAFRCYDAATGTKKWQVDGLGSEMDVVTADVDGDGRAEFLVGGTCIEATGPNAGQVRWRLNMATVGPPQFVDIDGDRLSEMMIMGADGKIRVLR